MSLILSECNYFRVMVRSCGVRIIGEKKVTGSGVRFWGTWTPLEYFNCPHCSTFYIIKLQPINIIHVVMNAPSSNKFSPSVREDKQHDLSAHRHFPFPLTTTPAARAAPLPRWSSAGTLRFARGSGPAPTPARWAPGGRWRHPGRRWARRPPLPRNRTRRRTEDR